MDLNIYYNNKVLSAQEREAFRIMSEETIRDFSESIEGFYELSQEFKPSQNKEYDKITKTRSPTAPIPPPPRQNI